MSKTHKIELLLAHEDTTWTTELFDIPIEIDRNDTNAVDKWIAANLYGDNAYRKVVLYAIYNTEPESNTDDPRIEECVRCDTLLTEDGRCGDETCPFSDCDQSDKKGWSGHPEMDDNIN